jgi:cholesterol oxidase
MAVTLDRHDTFDPDFSAPCEMMRPAFQGRRMPSLSTPIGELRSRYGVVVVGSGYGASIAAYRLAERAAEIRSRDHPTFSVCVLERGLEIPTGEYPSTLMQALRQMQVDSAAGHLGSATGLFDMRLNRDISALIGCGLGGGSLINAGVMIEPKPDVFDDEWPAAIRHAELQEYFDRVRRWLGAARVPQDIEVMKISRLFDAAGVPAAARFLNRPHIAVSFDTRVNTHGIQQMACVMCGDCMTGCNHAAKNTLVMNYLPAAANLGASIFGRMDVQAIERYKERWLVHVRVLDRAFRMFDSPEVTIHADAVFLGAGTLGSVEILLRSQRRGLALSQWVGRRFSGNGDVIAFAYNGPEPVNGFGYGSYVPPDANVGPLIGGMLDERDRPDSGALIQEGAIPGALVPLLRFAAPVMARVSWRPIDLSTDLRFRPFWREFDAVLRGVRHGALRRTQTFLGMGRDSANGVMVLRRGRLRIDWPKRLDDGVLGAITTRMGELTRGMKGRYLVNPFWSRVFGRRRVTVHPLGGARMADTAATGVVDADGRVFAGTSGTDVHPGLYVCDGAVIPTALGANPALTISAVAERIAERAMAGVEAITARGVADFVDAGRIRASVPGIHYAERLRGRITIADENGTPHQSRFSLVLHISAENIRALTGDDDHRASVVGVLRAPGLPSGRRRFSVSNGTFNVMVDDPTQVDSKLIKYEFDLTSEDGTQYVWVGQKEINHVTARGGFWKVVSSYPFRVRTMAGNDVGRGVARSSMLDAVRMVLSMRITHERAWLDRQIYKAHYRWYFVKAVLGAVLHGLARPVNPYQKDGEKAVPDGLRRGTPLQDTKRGSNRPRFTLTPYESTKPGAGDTGAVILAPGFGMSADAFLLDNSLTQHLCAEGYRVWLLDYRASDHLTASLEQFTIDDLAVGDESISGDFPDAIAAVREAEHRPVHVVAHCVASLTMFMALLKNRIPEGHLQSVVLSQSFACINHPWINQLKAWIRLPEFLRYMRFITVMSPDYDIRSGWRSRLLDRLLRLYPTNEPCSSGVCRRLLLMYGEVIRHDQLDKKTHDKLYDLFDRANMTTFVHLSKMIRKRRIVDRDGKDTYLTKENIAGITVPITLLQGTGNRLFRPRGAARTLALLHKYGGYGAAENRRRFTLEPLPGHGHLDSFIGKSAPRIVYPIISKALARANAFV